MKSKSKPTRNSPKISEILRQLETLAPGATAESWDNVGLLVGNLAAKSAGAIVSVDLTEEALEKAIQKNYKLIVTHHPPIFPKQKGIAQITASTLVYRCISNGINVISSHTNFDRCALEVVQVVSQGLGVVPQGRLIDPETDSIVKLSCYVPPSHLESVRAAVCEAGGGKIGDYDFCTFGVPGQGTFRPGPRTRPSIGKVGKIEKVDEVRLETILPRGLEKAVIAALKAAHPYEEVAYDLYPVEQVPAPLGCTRGLGYGFWGEFPSPKAFSEVAKDVRRLFKVSGFWLTDPAPKRIKRIAFVAGKGAGFLKAATLVGCDLFVTGEVGYHAVLHGKRSGMTVMELGHRESEFFYLKTMEAWLSKMGLKTLVLNIPTQKIYSGGST